MGNPLTESNNGFNASFGFDDLYRITGATDPSGSYSWGYDADNNRLSQLLNGNNTAYTVDTANHLTSVGGVMVIVDANGNLLDDGQGNTYTWDVRGRLTQIKHNGVTTATFQYNTDGIRTSETINGVTTNFTIDGSLCVLDNNATNTNPTLTMYGPGGPFCRGVQYYSPDASGSIATVEERATDLLKNLPVDGYASPSWVLNRDGSRCAEPATPEPDSAASAHSGRTLTETHEGRVR